ncbi:hypothetical protein CR983_01415 [Candidatus Saccharibacteria bacterium]|nr:MAG: hypothetical protein CR983_01415 [Candidatus Saccharibacteria bacterium]
MSASFSDKPPLKRWLSRLGVMLLLVVWLVIAGVVSAFVTQGIIWLLSQLLDMTQLTENAQTMLSGTVYYLVTAVIFITVPVILRHQQSDIRRILGLQRLLRWKDIGVALSGAVIYMIATVLAFWAIAALFPEIDLTQEQDIGIVRPFGVELLLVCMLLVVIGPFVEELLFRGYLYGMLRRIGIPFWLTTVVVSVLFGVAHGQWNVAINVAVLSVVMCAGREITGSLWPAFLIHALKNLLAFYLLFVS